jgi:hypothetical protein
MNSELNSFFPIAFFASFFYSAIKGEIYFLIRVNLWGVEKSIKFDKQIQYFIGHMAKLSESELVLQKRTNSQ